MLEILPVLLEIRSTPPMCDISSIFVTLNISFGKLLSLPFQRNWIHLFWSSYEKVIAFQVLQFHCFQAGVSGLLDRSLRSLVFLGECFSCSAPGGGRSFRPKGPEYPPQAGVSGPRGRSFCLCFSRLEMVHPLVGAGVSAPRGPEFPPRTGVSGY